VRVRLVPGASRGGLVINVRFPQQYRAAEVARDWRVGARTTGISAGWGSIPGGLGGGSGCGLRSLIDFDGPRFPSGGRGAACAATANEQDFGRYQRPRVRRILIIAAREVDALTETASGTGVREQLAHWVVNALIGADQAARIEATEAARGGGLQARVAAPAAISRSGNEGLRPGQVGPGEQFGILGAPPIVLCPLSGMEPQLFDLPITAEAGSDAPFGFEDTEPCPVSRRRVRSAMRMHPGEIHPGVGREEGESR